MPEFDIRSSTIEKGLDLVKGFLEKAIGPAVAEMGETLADNVRLRRLQNQINNCQKAKKIAEDSKIDIKRINLKAVVPYLEGVSLEENEDLQEMWVNLFVNYIDMKKNLAVNVYPDILRQLSTEEVGILRQMQANNHRNRIRVMSRSLHGQMQEPFAYFDQLTNLERLGIVEGITKYKGEISKYESGKAISQSGKEEYKIKQLSPDYYIITDFGEQFLEAYKR